MGEFWVPKNPKERFFRQPVDAQNFCLLQYLRLVAQFLCILSKKV